LSDYLQEKSNDAKIICGKIVKPRAPVKRPQSPRADPPQRRDDGLGLSPSWRIARKKPALANCTSSRVTPRALGQARPRPQVQAILPLRGKVLNVEKARFEKMLSSEQITTLIANPGHQHRPGRFNVDKLRYHRIIIMIRCDSTAPTSARCWLTLFYRQMPAAGGYAAHLHRPAPLYKVKAAAMSAT